MNATVELLSKKLALAVPLWIEKLKDQGTTLEQALLIGKERLEFVEAEMDCLLGKQPAAPGRVGAVFNALAEGVAALAFTPQGGQVFGLHFKVEDTQEH